MSENANSYWEKNPYAASQHQWTSNPTVADRVYRRMSAGASGAHWLTWLFKDYFGGRRFESLLSPGCGVGDHELAVARMGQVARVDAFDFSRASIDIARQKARAEGFTIGFEVGDLNTFSAKGRPRYDLVMCSGSLHHVRELESFLENVTEVLKPDGAFVFNEYVGATYNLYPPKQVAIVNRLLDAIAPELRTHPTVPYRPGTLRDALVSDPSESVRSSLILPFVEQYFDFEFLHPFGGAVLHPLYPCLNHELLAGDDPKSRTIAALLAEIEALLMEMPGGLPTDFAFALCRPKRR